MQLPQFITDAFPMLKATHELAGEIKELLGKNASASAALESATAALASKEDELTKARGEITTLKASLASLGDELQAAKNAETEAREKVKTPSRQAAEILATQVGVKIGDAPAAVVTPTLTVAQAMVEINSQTTAEGRAAAYKKHHKLIFGE